MKCLIKLPNYSMEVPFNSKLDNTPQNYQQGLNFNQLPDSYFVHQQLFRIFGTQTNPELEQKAPILSFVDAINPLIIQRKKMYIKQLSIKLKTCAQQSCT